MIDNQFPLYAIAFIMSLAITVIVGKIIIPILSARAEQPIYEGGPKWHISKLGTPTMGGLSFLTSVSIVTAVAAIILFTKDKPSQAVSLICATVYALLNSVVGIIDDATKLKNKDNAGLTPKEKLILQFLITAVFLVMRYILLDDASVISSSFGQIDLGIWYYPITAVILVGVTNFANLTDGIDGLASGVALAISISLFYISCALSDEISFISAALIGAMTGFLIFNIHPARIFMGDTGSLYLGALLAASAVTLNNPFMILLLGLVYVIEGVSVILQVVGYKLTKKRIFKMAPLHHHLEKCGWSENKICMIAIIITLIASIPIYALYLP